MSDEEKVVEEGMFFGIWVYRDVNDWARGL